MYSSSKRCCSCANFGYFTLTISILSSFFLTWRSLVTILTVFVTFPNFLLDSLWDRAVNEIEGTCSTPTEISEMYWTSDKDENCRNLYALTDNWSKPVIMRDFRNASHVSINRKYWDQYDFEEVLYRNQSLIYTFEGYGQTEKMVLNELLQKMDDGERLYVDFNNELTSKHPEIIDDLGVEPSICGRDAYFGELYFGYGHTEDSTGTKIHSEILDNVMLVIEGSRSVHLNPPHCNGLIRPTISNGHAYNEEWRQHKPLTRTAFESDHHPFLQCCDLHTTTLHTGDAMYIPPWWLHDIINNPRGQDPGFMVAISSRSLSLTSALWAKPDWTLYTIYRNLHRVFESNIQIEDTQHFEKEETATIVN